MVDREVMDQIQITLGQLEVPVTVIDCDPASVVSNTDQLHIRMSPLLKEDVPTVVMGRLCLKIRHPDLILVCDRTLEQGRSLLRLAAAMARQLQKSGAGMDSAPDALRQVLLGNMTEEDIESLCLRHHLNRMEERRVMIFHILQTEDTRTCDLLKDIAPLEEGDLLVDMDRHTAVMVKTVARDDSLDDALQYARALQETVMGETARTMTVGIGNTVADMNRLPESYREARRAIEVGKTFAPDTCVYAYSQLLLERFLMELPESNATPYLQVLFNSRTQKILNEEMFYTIETFFKKDLNLSDTARQLYIHRNTLVYRLDKVYRFTGLDLRRFEDAVTFKVFLELRKSRRKDLYDEPLQG